LAEITSQAVAEIALTADDVVFAAAMAMALIARITAHSTGRTPALTERQADTKVAGARLSLPTGSPGELANSRTPALPGGPNLREQWFEPSPFERDGAAAGLSVHGVRSEVAKPPHTTSRTPEFEFSVLNLNLMAPPGTAPII
jgi:hypothetical protein